MQKQQQNPTPNPTPNLPPHPPSHPHHQQQSSATVTTAAAAAAAQPTVLTAIPMKKVTTLANGNITVNTSPKMVLSLSAEQMKSLGAYLVVNNGKIAIQPNLISAGGGGVGLGGGPKFTLATTATTGAVGVGGTPGVITAQLVQPNNNNHRQHAVLVKGLPRTTQQQQQLTKIL